MVENVSIKLVYVNFRFHSDLDSNELVTWYELLLDLL